MRSPSELPSVDATSRIRYLDIVQRFLEDVPVVPLFISLENGGEPLRERVLVDVELVVELWIWIASESLIGEVAVNGGASGVIAAKQIIRLAILFKVLQLCLNLLIVGRFG